jgi:hypothetical protein
LLLLLSLTLRLQVSLIRGEQPVTTGITVLVPWSASPIPSKAETCIPSTTTSLHLILHRRVIPSKVSFAPMLWLLRVRLHLRVTMRLRMTVTEMTLITSFFRQHRQPVHRPDKTSVPLAQLLLLLLLILEVRFHLTVIPP